MKPKSIELHIEELVLQGMPAGDRQRIGAVVQRELTRMLAERGMPPAVASGAEIESLSGQSFELARGASPDAIGVQVARAVYGGIKR